MLELQMRVRAKEAKRKAEEGETAQRPTKVQCEREERMAKVQLKAFWTCFPLPDSERQAEDVPVEDQSEEELMESMWQDLHCNNDPKWDKGSDQELIVDEAGQHPQQEQTPMPQRRPQQHQQNCDLQIRLKQFDKYTTGTRHEFIKDLKISMSEKGEAGAKRRKLVPTISGRDQRTLNGDVEPAKDGLLQNRIQAGESRSSIKRVGKLEASNQEKRETSSQQREMQSIYNLIEAGKPR